MTVLQISCVYREQINILDSLISHPEVFNLLSSSLCRCLLVSLSIEVLPGQQTKHARPTSGPEERALAITLKLSAEGGVGVGGGRGMS